MKLKYVVWCCAVSVLFGGLSCWWYVQTHTFQFGAFDRSLFDKVQIEWDTPLVLWVSIEGTNTICHTSPDSNTIPRDYRQTIRGLAGSESRTVILVVSTNCTVAEVASLFAVATNNGIADTRILFGSTDADRVHSGSPELREIRLGPPRQIHDHMYEWYIEGARDRAQSTYKN